jgi:hypothetical protein
VAAAATLQKVSVVRNHFLLPSLLSLHPSRFDLVVFPTVGVVVAATKGQIRSCLHSIYSRQRWI